MRSFLATLILRLTGWKIEGQTPNLLKYVIIAAPHTSNWDFVYTMLLAAHFKLDMRWMGKHTIFRPPFGWFFGWQAGYPSIGASAIKPWRRQWISFIIVNASPS